MCAKHICIFQFVLAFVSVRVSLMSIRWIRSGIFVHQSRLYKCNRRKLASLSFRSYSYRAAYPMLSMCTRMYFVSICTYMGCVDQRIFIQILSESKMLETLAYARSHTFAHVQEKRAPFKRTYTPTDGQQVQQQQQQKQHHRSKEPSQRKLYIRFDFSYIFRTRQSNRKVYGLTKSQRSWRYMWL